ncbi:hypothetical protein MMC21_002332 [Puttea exsequens]|nr:hypothetical protein [Puttea exsequens]
MRPAIPSPCTGATQKKVVYVSAKTPFISAVKRVRNLLSEVDKRTIGKIDLVNGKGNDKQKLKKLAEQFKASKGKELEEVVLKATNRAIERALELALYFQGQVDCFVKLRTGTAGVVDDIAESEDITNANGDEGEEDDLAGSRIRNLSVLEVAINLK